MDWTDADEADWVLRHTKDVPAGIGDFLDGDGLCLEDKAVADIGNGDGLIDWGVVTVLKPRELVGYDLESSDPRELLRRLQAQGLAKDGLPPSLRFKICTPETIPAKDDSFDAVISWSAFEHIHNPVATIREVRRVLRPDGIFFVQTYPFFLSEHGSHLEEWYPQGFAHQESFDEIATRVSPGFAKDRELRPPQVGHARQGNKQPGDAMIWEYLNLNRIRLDELHRALLQGGFWVSKAELIAPAAHLPRSQNFRSLTEMLVAGIKLIAVPKD